MFSRPSYLFLLATLLAVVPAARGQTAISFVGPGTDWFTAANWSLNAVPDTGYQPTISNGQTVVIATTGAASGTMFVKGGGTLLLDGGVLTGGGDIWLATSGGTGTFTLQNSSSAAISGAITVGDNASLAGFLNVGTLSALTMVAGQQLVVGGAGAGTMVIDGGAQVTSDFASIASQSTSVGSATLSGTGSKWNISSDFSVGYQGQGTLTVQNGAAGSSGGTLSLGSTGTSALGTMTVTGTNSIWTANGQVEVTRGSLTIADGGKFINASPHALDIAATGALSIGSGALSGTLQVDSVTNAGALIFNHTDNLAFGGLLTGAGSLTKQGAGTLTLSNSANTYTGVTWIKDGTIAVGALANFSSASPLGAPASGAIKLGEAATTGTLRYTGAVKSISRTFDLAGVTGGGALDASGTGALTITGAIGATGLGSKTLTLTGASTAANTLSGIISNNSGTNATALAKTGAGSWVVSGINTFTGGVTIAGGNLTAATSANALGIGASTVSLTGGNLTLAGTGSLSFSRNTTVSSSGTITIDRTASSATGLTHTLGTLVIGGQTLTVAKGSLITGSGVGGLVFLATTLTGSPTFSVGTNATLTLGVTGDGGNGLGLTKTGAGTMILGNDNTFTGTTTISAGTLQLGTGGATGALAGSIVDNGTLAINRTGNFSLGAISGSGAITKTGTGNLTLAGGNSYTGATTITTGTITLTGNGALGTVAGGTTVNSGATLALQGGFDYTTAEPLTLNTSTTGSLNSVSGTNSFAGPITLVGLSRILVAPTSQLTLSGQVSGSPQISFNGGGTASVAGGTLVLTNATNDFTGALTVGGFGTVVVANNLVLGGSFGTVSVNSGTIAFQGGIAYTDTNRTLILSATPAPGRNGTLDNLSGNNSFAGAVQAQSSLSLIGAATGTQLTLSGVIGDMSGTAGFGWGPNFVGPGTIVISGDNSVNNMKLTSGTLRATTSANALGLNGTNSQGHSYLEIAGGRLELANDTSLAFGRDVLVSGSATIASDLLHSGAGVTHTLGALSIGAQTLTVASGGNVNSGTAGLTFGATTLSAAGATFSPGAGVLLTLTSVVGTNTSFTVAGAGDTRITGAVATGSGALVKSGAGTLTLSATNTYGGATAVNAGTLFVDGSLTSSPVTVNSGGTLGGSGSIGGLATFASGGHLAPGDSPGTLTFTHGLTLQAGAILDFQLGTTSDLIRVSGGTLSGANGIVLNLSDAGAFAVNTPYKLIDFTGADATGFVTTYLTLGTAPSGYTYDLTLNNTAHALQLTATVSAIPEPSTYAAILGALALGAAGVREHRKRRKPAA